MPMISSENVPMSRPSSTSIDRFSTEFIVHVRDMTERNWDVVERDPIQHAND